jgi:hypothetical protein
MRHLTVTDSDIIESVGFGLTRTLDSGVAVGSLEVVFKSSPDQVYRYDDVDADTFARLVSAESIGKAFHEAFRKTKYPFTKSERTPALKK